MKRTLVVTGAGLVCLLCVSGVQAQQRVTREDELGKQGRQQAADPEAPSRAVQAPSEVVPQLVVPRLVKFSGVANDELGKPRMGTIGITLAIYKDREGGAPLWLETQNIELDEQGRYTVLLGATKSEGLPLELFASGESRWLGAQVQLSGEVEQPRVLLVSVPYALKAADAETLGGMPASAFVLAAPNGTASGTSTSGTTTQTSANSKTAGKTTAKGAAKIAAAATPIAANFIPVFIDNSGTLGSSAMSQSGSNIGIGTTTPGATLDVNGGTRAASYGFLGNAPVPTNATATIFDQANVGPTFSGFSFSVRTGVTPAPALNVDPSQNVSIAGNTSIAGNAAALAYKFTGNAAPPTDATATILNQANVGPVFSGLSFRVRTGAPMPADALTVDQNQNVGIGTTTPAAKLHAQNGASAFTSDILSIDGLAGECNSNGCAAVDAITSGPSGVGVFAEAQGMGAIAVQATTDVATSVQADTSSGNAVVADVSGPCTSSTSACNLFVGQGNLGTNVIRIDSVGKGFFNGGTQTGGADFAESVGIRGERSQYESSDVLVVDRAAGRRLMLSRRAYSTRVAGIYSTKPGVLATTHSIDESDALAEEIPVAIVGIVPCKVTTENGPIAPGDLLVTSSAPGYAMKGTNRRRMLGAIVGKALEPLREGKGVIQVLVTLQ